MLTNGIHVACASSTVSFMAKHYIHTHTQFRYGSSLGWIAHLVPLKQSRKHFINSPLTSFNNGLILIKCSYVDGFLLFVPLLLLCVCVCVCGCGKYL